MATTAMTARQRGKIFAMAKTLCVGDDELHDIVRGLTGCDSIRELSGKQAIRVIDRLNGYGTGSVVELPEEELDGAALAGAVEELEKN